MILCSPDVLFHLEPVSCSMSSSNCCFLTCIHISQEADQVVWYSHLFQTFPQFIVIHTVKGFGIVNKAEIDALLECSCFFNDSADVGNLISGSSAFLKPAWTFGSSRFTYCWQTEYLKRSLNILPFRVRANNLSVFWFFCEKWASVKQLLFLKDPINFLFYLHWVYLHCLGFPGGSVVKNLPAKQETGDADLISGSGRRKWRRK